ncbi:hypothetical protein BEK67_15155 [Ralstonia pickettii]|nr:hypothetical protein BEK67_15155 [Ralstonia pickettii]
MCRRFFACTLERQAGTLGSAGNLHLYTYQAIRRTNSSAASSSFRLDLLHAPEPMPAQSKQ